MLAKWISENTTQAKFARDTGCSESHLSLILKGKRGVSFPKARRISEATGGAVPIDVLMTGRASREAAE